MRSRATSQSSAATLVSSLDAVAIDLLSMTLVTHSFPEGILKNTPGVFFVAA